MCVMVEWKPSPSVFMISTVFLEAKCAIRTHKNVDTMVSCVILERSYDLAKHDIPGEV
jgi:hypothetical protein